MRTGPKHVLAPSPNTLKVRTWRHRQRLIARFEALAKRDPEVAGSVLSQWEAALATADGLEALAG